VNELFFVIPPPDNGRMTILYFPEQQFESPSTGRADQPFSLSISCGDCSMRGSSACDDCVVTLLCDGPSAQRRVDLTDDEAAAVNLFAKVGLVPASRHAGRVSRKALAG
jgi:hypothetical protein